MSNQEANIKLFLEQCNFEKKNYNYLLTGTNGSEKLNFVIEIIKTYFFNKDQIDLKDPLNHPDVKYISLPIYDKSSKRIGVLPEADRLQYDYGLIDSLDTNKIGKEIVIDQIRELTDFLNLSSYLDHKFVIINKCDYLNRESSAAILKTLEETNSSSIFFLITSELSSVSDTIISRCQKFNYKRKEISANYSSYYEYYISSLPIEIVTEHNSILSKLETVEDDISALNKRDLPALTFTDKWSQFDKLLIDYLINLFSLLLKGRYLDNKTSEIYKHLQQKIILDEDKLINILKTLLKKKSEYLNVNINKKLFFDDLLIVINNEL